MYPNDFTVKMDSHENFSTNLVYILSHVSEQTWGWIGNWICYTLISCNYS
jgi:hypothetical protein